MKDILKELNKSSHEIRGSFIVNEKGKLEGYVAPDEMADSIKKIALTLHHVSDYIKKSRSLTRLTVHTGNVQLIAVPFQNRILGILANKGISPSLFKLSANLAVTKLKETPKLIIKKDRPKSKSSDWGEVCDLYEKLYVIASDRLINIIGSKSAEVFFDDLADVKKRYPVLFGNLSIGSMGRPDMTTIRGNMSKMASKNELIVALEDLLLSMLETIKNNAGEVQEQKALEELQKVLGENQNILI